MKHYKNILFSTASYIVAIVWFLFTEHSLFYKFPTAVAIPSIILGLAGIFFSLKSIKAKETKLVSQVSIAIGLIIVLIVIAALLLEMSPI